MPAALRAELMAETKQDSSSAGEAQAGPRPWSATAPMVPAIINVRTALACFKLASFGGLAAFRDEREEELHEVTYKYTGGIVDFVKHLNASKEALHKRIVFFEESQETSEVEVALQWNTGYYEGLHSFANGIPTGEGGMHEEASRRPSPTWSTSTGVRRAC